MKTLLVRPGTEIVEKTLKGPWPAELSYLGKLYNSPGIVFSGIFVHQSICQSSVLSVGSVLRQLGEDVEYLDVPFEYGLPQTEELNIKRNKKVEEYIAKGQYDVVGISCTSVSEGVATQRVAEAAKRALKDVKVVVGGYEATSNGLDLMKKIKALDVIVLSDFEPIAERLYQSLDGTIPIKAVPNVLYREDGTVRASERKHFKLAPGDLPTYDYSLVKEYIPRYTLFTVASSRGCPYECTFCQEKVVRKSYTVKEASAAVNEIIDAANYIAQFVESVSFGYSDSLWGLHPRWVKAFCSELAERREEISARTFGWIVESRVGQFDDEQLKLMKKAGCTLIGYGVESLSPRILTVMNKARNPQEYINSLFDAVEKTVREDIHAALLLFLGMPGETPSTIEETLNLIEKLPLGNKNLHVQFGLASAFAGTELDRQIHDPDFVKEHGVRIIAENDWEKAYIPRYTMLFDPSRELSASEMVDIFLNTTNRTQGIPTAFLQIFSAEERVRIVGSVNRLITLAQQ